MKTIATSLFCTALALALSPTTASAVTVAHQTTTNGACVSAFSNQVVRNRPTGVRNTGTAAIYVTCSMPGDTNGGSVNYHIYLRVANFGTSTQQINCNIQTGWTEGVTNTTVQGAHSKGVSVAANDYQWLHFYTSDYSLSTFYNVNAVCLLPPQTELQYIGHDSNVEVGA